MIFVSRSSIVSREREREFHRQLKPDQGGTITRRYGSSLEEVERERDKTRTRTRVGLDYDLVEKTRVLIGKL